MTNKKKILLPVLICALIVSVLTSVIFLSRAGESIKFSYELQSEYTRGITITLPEAEVDGTTLKHTLAYPDGRSTTYGKVTLDQAGEYTLTYYADKANEAGAVEKTFYVKDSFSGMFTCSEGVEIVGETDIPEYINVEGNTVNGAGETPAEWYGHTSGVKFKATQKGATIDYNGIIDLKKLGNQFSESYAGWWNNLDTSFIEFLVTPEDTSKRELDYLEITLTDVYDPTNYLFIDVTATDAGISTSMATCYIACAPKGLYETIGKPSSSLQGEMGIHGTSIRSTFYGQVGTNDTDSIRLFFDTTRNALWANPVTPARYPRPIFENFDNPDLVGLENLWYGFTTGEVYLSIRVGSMATKEASFMILSVGEQTVDSNYQTGTEQSEIVIDFGEYMGKELPYGVAGTDNEYPVFKATAHNKVCGLLNEPEVNVYYGGEDGSSRIPLVISNDRFKTENAGKYYIVYTSKTVYGKAQKTLEIEVLSDYKPQDVFTLTLSDKLTDKANIGDVIYLYDPVVTGGVGTKTIKKNVYYRTPAGDEIVTLNEEGLYPIFTVEKEGEYVLEYVAIDELSTHRKQEQVVTSQYHEKPFIIEPNLPSCALMGRKITLPLTTANYVDSTGAYETEVKISVNGVDYTNKEYLVDGDFTVKYTATVKGKPGISNEASYDVKAVNVTEGDNYFSNYFIFSDKNGDGENDFSYSVAKNGAQFTTSVSGAKAQFANYMPVQLLGVKFTVPDVNGSVDRVNVYITDSANKSQSVKLSVVKVENHGVDYSMFAINDQIKSTISGSWNADERTSFALLYEYKNNGFVDARGKNIGTVENYSNGQAFKGFSSGMVYVEMEIELKSSDSATIALQEISGQAFNSDSKTDEGRPQLIVLEDVPTTRYASVGERFYIPKAYAFDLLSNISEFSCVVSTPNEDDEDISVDKFDGTFSVVANEPGTYIIKFVVKDSNGKKMQADSGYFYVIVRENNAPEVTMGEVKTKYKVGDTLEVPSITVTDDTTEEPSVITYLQDPNYKVVTSLSGYKFERTGKYVLTVYASDEFSNYVVKRVEIFVTE